LRKEIEQYKDVWDLEFNYEDSILSLKIENLFEHCYELDENEAPARYKLKQLDKTLPNYNFKV
jgi:hypothetical protein